VTTPHLVPDRRSPPSSNEPIALAPSMVAAISLAHAFAAAATPVFVCGESGTGKTWLAEYIHQLSQRPDGFHALSLGLLAPQLVADELFGHVEGAFTDARRKRTGMIASAGRGTLLLDDGHTADLGIQKQLLQLFDRGIYRPVGSDRVHTSACRIILAMTERPDVLVREGQLLPDLRYRFGECAIYLPPLRERREEIPKRAYSALRRCADKTGLDGPGDFSDEAMVLLGRGTYEGNIRQLEGMILRAYLVARDAGAGQIDVEHLPSMLKTELRYRRRGQPEENRPVIELALSLARGNLTEAARLVDLSRTGFYHAVRRLSKDGRRLAH
jgi:DNA-binding NtrC family response regulator